MEEAKNDYNQGAKGGIIVLIVLGIVGWWFYNKWVETDYSKPWWNGTESQEVCESGTLGGDCVSAQVTSDGQNITTIYLANDELAITDTECFEAARFSDFDRFCRVWDVDGNRFDVNPGPLPE